MPDAPDITFENVPVLVTGAAQGIGRELAAAFAGQGARVAMVDREAELLAEAAGTFADKGLDVLPIAEDVASWDGARRAVDGAAEAFGGLAVLVNNAGGSAHTSVDIDEVDEEGLDRVLAWNIKTTFLCTKAALPHFRARGGGSVVNIGAIAGRAGTELLPPQYSAAKAGVMGLTRNLARHLGPRASGSTVCRRASPAAAPGSRPSGRTARTRAPCWPWSRSAAGARAPRSRTPCCTWPARAPPT